MNIFLRKAALNGQLYDRFESYVANMLFKIPCPDRLKHNLTRVYLPSPDSNTQNEQFLKFSEPSYAELPALVKEAIPCLFTKLSLQNIQRILKCMLLDERIKIFGDDRNEIYFCCEALRSLIFPFKYSMSYGSGHQYISYMSLRYLQLSS